MRKKAEVVVMCNCLWIVYDILDTFKLFMELWLKLKENRAEDQKWKAGIYYSIKFIQWEKGSSITKSFSSSVFFTFLKLQMKYQFLKDL